jgi:hypothetical protein
MRAHRLGAIERGLHQVRGDDPRGAAPFRHRGLEQADRARADDQHLATHQLAGPVRGVHADRQRLGQRRLLEGQMRRDLHALLRVHHDGLGEAALHMRPPAGAAHEEHVRAEVDATFLAAHALAAAPRRVHRHTVADLDAGRGVDLDHLAREFVSQHQRLDDRKGAGAPLHEIMQVRSADAATAEAQSHATRRHLLLGDAFKAQIARAVDNGGKSHGRDPFSAAMLLSRFIHRHDLAAVALPALGRLPIVRPHAN